MAMANKGSKNGFTQAIQTTLRFPKMTLSAAQCLFKDGPPSKKLKQMHLDAGQKHIGHTTCPTCGMVYVPGNKEDEQLHVQRHAAAKTSLSFRGWTTERCLLRDSSGRLLHILPSDPQPHQKKIQELCQYLESQYLGLPPGWCLRKDSSLSPLNSSPTLPSHLRPLTDAKKHTQQRLAHSPQLALQNTQQCKAAAGNHTVQASGEVFERTEERRGPLSTFLWVVGGTKKQVGAILVAETGVRCFPAAIQLERKKHQEQDAISEAADRERQGVGGAGAKVSSQGGLGLRSGVCSEVGTEERLGEGAGVQGGSNASPVTPVSVGRVKDAKTEGKGKSSAGSTQAAGRKRSGSVWWLPEKTPPCRGSDEQLQQEHGQKQQKEQGVQQQVQEGNQEEGKFGLEQQDVVPGTLQAESEGSERGKEQQQLEGPRLPIMDSAVAASKKPETSAIPHSTSPDDKEKDFRQGREGVSDQAASEQRCSSPKEAGQIPAAAAAIRPSGSDALNFASPVSLKGSIVQRNASPSLVPPEKAKGIISPELQVDSSAASGGERQLSFHDVKERSGRMVQMGVKMMWVAPELRRTGVGRRMLDVARCHLIPNFQIPRSSVAFSHTPLIGAQVALAFAAAYCANPEGHLLVYDLEL